jgi:hypothetical protein
MEVCNDIAEQENRNPSVYKDDETCKNCRILQGLRY